MKQLYIDCTNGISGDMMLNALKGLGADEAGIDAELQKIELRAELHSAEHAADAEAQQGEPSHHSGHPAHNHDGAPIDGSPGAEKHGAHHDTKVHPESQSAGEAHAHTHTHRSYREIKQLIHDSKLSPKVKDTALEIYRIIAEGEAKVHETAVEDVHFHEVGRDRAVANIVGIAAALEDLQVQDIYCSEIHDGKGFIQCSHGKIPVPVPAVMAIREHCDYRFVIDAEVHTEMVTPSGLGILVGIGAKMTDTVPEGEIIKTATGKGSRDTGREGLKVTLMRKTETNREQPQPIKNDLLLANIRRAKESPSQENTVAMLNQVVRAKLIAPITLDKEPIASDTDGQVTLEKDTEISFEMIASNTGDLFYPVFTHGEEMKKCSKEKDQHSLLVNFEDLANMVLNQQQAVRGFVINPMGDNICFTAEMIASMMEEIRGAKAGQ